MIDAWWVLAQILAGGFGALARFGVMTVVRPGVWSWGLFAVVLCWILICLSSFPLL